MKYYLILFLFFYSSSYSKVLVTLDPNNCLTCSSGLYALSNEPLVAEILVIIDSEYKIDSSTHEQLFEFRRFGKFRIIYSDSLFNSKSKSKNAYGIANPELIIEDDYGNEKYRSPLAQLDFPRVIAALNYQKGLIQSRFCLDSLHNKRAFVFNVINDYIHISDSYRVDNCIFDIRSNRHLCIPSPSNVIEDLYRALYDHEFQRRYPVIRTIIKDVPTFKPTIVDVIDGGSQSLFVLFEMKDYVVKSTIDTGIYLIPLVGKLDLETGKFIDYFVFESNITDSFFLWNLYGDAKNTYVSGKEKSGEFVFLSVFLDEECKRIRIRGNHSVEIPRSYRNISVPDAEVHNICFGKDCLSFVYSDSILNFGSNLRVKIPYASTTILAYDANIIRDLYFDGDYYYVLYVHEHKSLKVLKMTHKGELVKTFEIGDKDDIFVFSGKFFNGGNRIVYREKEPGCYVIGVLNQEK